MDIEYFVSHIEEELEGAKDYIKRAIEIKPMQAEWAKHLVEMSAQELSHATHLFNMFNEYYQILSQTYKEMQQMSAKMDECCCSIKTQMLQDRYEDERAKNVTLQNALDNANQSQYILGQLGRFVAWAGSGSQAAAVTAG